MVGATGLVGSEVVRLLAQDPFYGRVIALTRRTLDAPEVGGEGGRVIERIISFDRLEEHRADVVADHVFCALGTTRRKAGSRERFREVDHGYPLRIARMARDNGARHFSLVSAVGAAPDARFFYSRVKGELERDIRAIGYPSVAILRPSILAGRRREARPLERMGRLLLRLVPGRAHPVHARDVAAAMIRLAKPETPGVAVLESEAIRRNRRKTSR